MWPGLEQLVPGFLRVHKDSRRASENKFLQPGNKSPFVPNERVRGRMHLVSHRPWIAHVDPERHAGARRGEPRSDVCRVRWSTADNTIKLVLSEEPARTQRRSQHPSTPAIGQTYSARCQTPKPPYHHRESSSVGRNRTFDSFAFGPPRRAGACRPRVRPGPIPIFQRLAASTKVPMHAGHWALLSRRSSDDVHLPSESGQVL